MESVKVEGRCEKTGKYQYRTMGQALAALLDIREKRIARGNTGPMEERVIDPACEFCGMYHLTHLTEEEYHKLLESKRKDGAK